MYQNNQRSFPASVAGNAPMYGAMGNPSQMPMEQPMYAASPLRAQPMQPSFPTIPGRLIRDAAEIKPNEIPMDGSVSLFPNADYSLILAKAWNQDGTIDTVRFVREVPPQPKNERSMDEVLSAIAALGERFDRLESMVGKKPTASKTKEASGNE